ncbi:AraC family transcriptional regulator [Paenibacillus sp. MBLB4367]|uniref:AraC family transcriptional regulator n=1 Tax=Paenibacillus sp. MBLB4367 TaxID=3384767 RepID=UPI00390842BA
MRQRMKEYDSEYAELIYCTPSALEKEGALWLLRAGRCEAKPNYKAGPKWNEYFSIHFVREGQVLLTYKDRRVALRKGDLFTMFPHDVYEYKIDPAVSRLEMAWINFEGRHADRLLRAIGMSEEVPFLQGVLNKETEDLVRQLLQAIRSSYSEGSCLQAIGLLYGLFARLTPAPAGPSVKQTRTAWLDKSVEFIHTHVFEGVSVEDAAHYVGVHRSYFSGVFAERMGVSPIQYMQRLKMDKSALLLHETDKPVTEIALSVGYPDLYAFTRAFTAYFGMSPTKYRRRAQG